MNRLHRAQWREQPQHIVRVNPADQFADGLVAWMPGNGIEYDGSLDQRGLVAAGGLAYATYSDPRFGDVRAPAWDGTDDEVSTAFPFLAEFSLLAWVYFESTTDVYRNYISRGAVFATDANFAFGYRSSTTDRRLFCYARNAGALLGGEIASTLLEEQTWNRIGASWKSGAQAFYINGAQVGTAVAGNGSDGGQSLRFGAPSETATDARANRPGFDLRVYNRVLTAAEFAEDYERSPHELFEPLPRRMWAAPAVTGIPVLSAATVTSITSTTATPRVTITF